MKYKINYSIGGTIPSATIPIGKVEELINPLAENMSNEDIIINCSLDKTFCRNMNWRKLINDRNIKSVLNFDNITPKICNNTITGQLPFCKEFYNYTKYTKYTKHFKTKTIATDFRNCMALKNDGTVVVWGDNTYGQCNVPDGLNNVVSIATGIVAIMALKNDGIAVVWGSNEFGQRVVPNDLIARVP